MHDFSRLTGTPRAQALEAFIQFAAAPPAVNPKDLMAQGLKELNFDDLSEVAPAFVTMLMIPLTFSITEGIGIGLVIFVFVMILLNRVKEVPLFSYFVAALFLVYYGLK